MDIMTAYRKKYIENRTEGNMQPDSAHSAALENIYIRLLHESALKRLPISNSQLEALMDLNKNLHYMQLLEDIITLPESEQKEYLRKAAKVPKLLRVK